MGGASAAIACVMEKIDVESEKSDETIDLVKGCHFHNEAGIILVGNSIFGNSIQPCQGGCISW